MTFFQVNCSSAPKIKIKEKEEPIECRLAPFSTTAKVNFFHVAVGTTASQNVYMKNPGNCRITADLKATKEIKAAGFEFNAECITVEPGQSFTLTINWRPIEAGSHCFTLSVSTNLPRVKCAIQIIGSAVLSKKTVRKSSRMPSALKDNTYNIQSGPFNSNGSFPSPAVDRKTFTVDSFEGRLPRQLLPVVDEPKVEEKPLAFIKQELGEPDNAEGDLADKENYEDSLLNKSSNDDLIVSFGRGFDQLLLSDLTERECLKSIQNHSTVGVPGVNVSTPATLTGLSTPSSMEEVFSLMKPTASRAGLHLVFDVTPTKSLLDSGTPKKINNGDGLKHQIDVHPLSPRSQTFKKPLNPREEPVLCYLSEQDCVQNLSSVGVSGAMASTPMKQPGPSTSWTVEKVFSPMASTNRGGRHFVFEVSPPKSLLDSGAPKKIKNVDGVKHRIDVHALSPKSILSFKKPQIPRQVKQTLEASTPDLYNMVNTKQLNELLAWLNSLLSPLRELHETKTEAADVTQAWQQVTRHGNDTSNLTVARDEVCQELHITDLERRRTLVKAASALYASDGVRIVLMQLKVKIQSGFLEMKDDVDVFYDTGYRIKLCNLVVKYSPIWLTICLEAIFGEAPIPSENGWKTSLLNFINSNLLNDKRSSSRSQYFTKYRTPGFKKKINQSFVFKFISLVFFLDYAKKRRLIPFDPCLFNKNSPIKDSEAMLNEFIRDFIKCTTRMKQTFNAIGLCLTYKQTALDEYDMQVSSHLDLRDGVRLARLLEIIFKNCTLCDKLRVPPVSRLQKIHNVKLVLNALKDRGICISEDITPNDVVDGHRENITSLVWQILHKFLLPRKEAAAKTLQRWWRSFPVRIKLRMKHGQKIAGEVQQTAAAVKIQSWWRGVAYRRHRWDSIKSQLVLNRARREACVKIQRWYRTSRLLKAWHVLVIEQRRLLAEQKRLEGTVRFVQGKFRAKKQGKVDRTEFLTKRASTLTIQTWYRGIKAAQRLQEYYQSLRVATMKIQQLYRARKLGALARSEYLKVREAVVSIQRWYLTMKCRKKFLSLRAAAVSIQIRFRSRNLGRAARKEYLMKRAATLKIQRWYRAITAEREDRHSYLCLRDATLFIQRQYRASKLCRIVRADFLEKRSAVVKIQRWYRMQKARKQFLRLRHCAVFVQTTFRLHRAVRLARNEFLGQRTAAIKIQKWYRATMMARRERQNFIRLKKITHDLQIRFRARQIGRSMRSNYLRTRTAAVTIQRWYRTRLCRQRYLRLKSAAQMIQSRYRMKLVARAAARRYKKTIRAVVTIQRWFRAKKERQHYLRTKQVAIQIQTRFRARRAGRVIRLEFLQVKQATVTIQRWFVARQIRKKYLALRAAAIMVQSSLRRRKMARTDRSHFLEKRDAALKIQRWYRNRLACRSERLELQSKREEAKRIFRMFAVPGDEHEAVVNAPNPPPTLSHLMKMSCRIQRWYRGVKLVREARAELHRRVLERNKTRGAAKKATDPRGNLAHSSHSTHSHSLDGFICPCRAQTRRHKTASKTLRESFNSCVETITSRNHEVVVLWKCCKDLDFITDHSSILCEELIAHPTALRFLWTTINKDTRTEQQQDIICFGFNVFINLGLYARTKAAIWQSFLDNDGCGIILSIMGKYVSKPSPIFCKAATILWLFINNDRGRVKFVKTYKDSLKLLAFYFKKVSTSSTSLANESLQPSRLENSPRWGYNPSGSTREFKSKKTALICLNSFLKFSSTY